MSIFLAEDNPADVHLVRVALRAHKIEHHLSLAKDGAEAKHYIQGLSDDPTAPCPDVILLDVNLPQTSGFELLALFRKHPRCAETPVIIVTSSSAASDRQKAGELGAVRYFTKPLDLQDFLTLGAVVLEVVG